MPKWGLSKGDYFFDKEKNVIAKGLTSIKYMSNSIADELYNLAKSKTYRWFVDILSDINATTSIDSRQLNILIKLDFFSEYGNQRELLRITDMFYDTFSRGLVKKISKDKVAGTPLEKIIQKYAVGVTKSGGEAKSYTILDITSIMREVEDAVKAVNMEDLSDILKVRNFADVMGYVGYVSGKQEDRPKLYVIGVYPLHRRSDNKQFGYSVVTKSIGSGIEGRFTVYNRVFDEDPIHKDDIILCKSFEKEKGKYFVLTGYVHIY